MNIKIHVWAWPLCIKYPKIVVVHCYTGRLNPIALPLGLNERKSICWPSHRLNGSKFENQIWHLCIHAKHHNQITDNQLDLLMDLFIFFSPLLIFHVPIRPLWSGWYISTYVRLLNNLN